MAHGRVSYPGDLAADVLAPEAPPRPLLLRIVYAAGALASAAAVTLAVLRFGSIVGTDPNDWRRQVAGLGDRGRALVASVSSSLPTEWNLPDVRLPRMSHPSEFPQHLRMMSPLNRLRTPELPEKMSPEPRDDESRQAA